MFRDKKHLIRLLFLTLSLLLLSSSPAAAAISGFVAKSDEGELYEYRYDELLDSYALNILGLSNGLYEDFSAKKTYAFLNNTGEYIDYTAALDRYARALIQNEKFDLSEYVISTEAKKAQMPASVYLVRLSAGEITSSAKTLSSAGSDSNLLTETPKTKTPIVGPAKYSLELAQKWARSREADQRFIDIAPLYWKYGQKTGIRPEVLYVQAAIETDFGKYSNRVPSLFNNWAGIKTAEAGGDAISDHEVFNDPEEGVRAHYNHMAAYVGLEPLGEPHGRYFVVAGQSWAGSIKNVEDLSGKWTPMPDYHSYILNLLDQISKAEFLNLDAEQEKLDSKPGSNNMNEAERRVAVDVAVLHLRSGPGTDHEIIERLHLGTTLQVKGNQAEWLNVIIPGDKHGWVHGDYVREIDLNGLAENPFKGKIIVIDPGHGGSDMGATGATGIQEKVINLVVAHKLLIMLEKAGATVVMTRYGDQSVTNLQRVEVANKARANLFISIHANAYANPDSNGTETHYYPEHSYSNASRYLAHQLQRELVSALKLRDRGVKSSSFFVLKNLEMPAALVEMAFLTNLAEEEILKSDEAQNKAAQALYRGIEAYLSNFR